MTSTACPSRVRITVIITNLPGTPRDGAPSGGSQVR
jgi:hypothetical protein